MRAAARRPHRRHPHGEPTFLELLEHLLERRASRPIVLVVHRAARAAREATRSGGRGRARRQDLACRRWPREDTEPPRRRAARRHPVDAGGQRADRRRRRGQPAVRRAAGLDARRQGLIRLEGDAGSPPATLAEVEVPPTIQALLASRLDDLSREERAVIEPASVIGLSFPRAGRRGAGARRAAGPGCPRTCGRWTASSSWTGPAPRAATTRSTASATS